ncbi:NEDD4-binding protein 2-like isoform X3 [Lampetra planeri]
MPRKKRAGVGSAQAKGPKTPYGLHAPAGEEAWEGGPGTSTTRGQVVDSMVSMFPNLDPQVVYIVLVECDFSADVAMDSLLELSGAVGPRQQLRAEGLNAIAHELMSGGSNWIGDYEQPRSATNTGDIVYTSSSTKGPADELNYVYPADSVGTVSSGEQSSANFSIVPSSIDDRSALNLLPSEAVSSVLEVSFPSSILQESVIGTTGSDRRHQSNMSSGNCGPVSSNLEDSGVPFLQQPAENCNVSFSDNYGSIVCSTKENMRADRDESVVDEAELELQMAINEMEEIQHNEGSAILQEPQSNVEGLADSVKDGVTPADCGARQENAKDVDTSSSSHGWSASEIPDAAFRPTSDSLRESGQTVKVDGSIESQWQQNENISTGQWTPIKVWPPSYSREETHPLSQHEQPMTWLSGGGWQGWGGQPLISNLGPIPTTDNSWNRQLYGYTEPGGNVSSMNPMAVPFVFRPNAPVQKHTHPLPKQPWPMQALPVPRQPFPLSKMRSRSKEGKVLFVLRGLPGSGKSTLARNIKEQGPNGVILSTDDYFVKNGTYCYDPSVLGEAHEWNHKRARDAMDAGMSPIIIDNTNTHSWEMRPYVAMALQRKYKIVFKEPETPWKFKTRELEKRNVHGISREKIVRMLNNYERHMTVERIMGSFKAPRDHWVGQEDVKGKSKQMLAQTERAALQQAVNHENGSLPCAGRPSNGFKQHSLGNTSSEGAAVTVNKNIEDNSDARSTENIILPDVLPLESRAVAEGLPKTLASDCQAEVIEPDKCFAWSKTADSGMNAVDNQVTDNPIALSMTMKKRTRTRRLKSPAKQIPQQTSDLSRNEFDPIDDWPSDTPTAPLGQRVRRQRHDSTPNTEEVESQAAPDLTICHLPGCETAASASGEVNESLDAGNAQVMSIEKLQEDFEPSATQKQPETDACMPADIVSTGPGEGADMAEEDVFSVKQPHDHTGADFEKNKEAVRGQPGGIVSASCTDKVTAAVEGRITGRSDNVPHVLKVASSSLVAENPFLAQVMETVRLKQNEQLAVSIDAMEGSHDPKGAAAVTSMPRSAKTVELVAHFSQALSLQNDDNTVVDSRDKSARPLDRKHQSTHTAPEDFALIWKVTKNKLDSVDPFVVVCGNPDRFTIRNEAVATADEAGPNIPYKLKLDKGILTDDMENPEPERDAEYLVTHFRSVSREVLVDIYEKCNRNLNWTVNVLIESGVEMSEEISEKETDTEVSSFIDEDVLQRIETMECSTKQNTQVLNRVLQSDSSMQPDVLCHTSRAQPVGKQTETGPSNTSIGTGSKEDESGIDFCPKKYVVEDTLVDWWKNTPPRPVGEVNTAVLSDFGRQKMGEEIDGTTGTGGQHIDNVKPKGNVVPGESRNEVSLGHETKGADCERTLVNNDVNRVEGETDNPAEREERDCCEYSAAIQDDSMLDRKIITSIDDKLRSSDNRVRASETVTTWEQLAAWTAMAPGNASNASLAAPVLEAAGTSETPPAQPAITRGIEIEAGAVPRALSRGATEGSAVGQVREVEGDDLFDKGSGVGRTAQPLAGDGANSLPHLSTLEFSLPHELAIQLIELFGSIGLDESTGDFSCGVSLAPEDLAVRIDMKMAQMIHQHWKDSVMARQKEEALSYQLLQEDARLSHLMMSEDDQAADRPSFSQNRGPPRPGSASNATLGRRQQWTSMPVSLLLGPSVDEDLWDSPYAPSYRQSQGQPSSLLDIMSEELASQLSREEGGGKTTRTRKDVSAKLKEQKLFELFPGIDRQFLMDVYRDHDYSLDSTQQFLSSVLATGTSPARTVVASDVYSENERQELRTALRLSLQEHALHGTGGAGIPATSSPSQSVAGPRGQDSDDAAFQDTEAPDYADFRAEAFAHHQRRRECFQRAAEACHRGMRDVAMHYARQGHLHGEKMKESNALAAHAILQQRNVALLPHSILDLHGLHVGEATAALADVLEQRQRECQAQGKSSVLSVITGQGNNSRGGVSRLKPAVLDYLRKNKYRFSEPHAGLVKVHLPRAREV